MTDVALFAGMMVPYAVLAGLWVRSGWFPIQDQAVLDLRMQDLIGGRPPLVGAFSRYGWSHPGPVWYFALAPFRILGGADWLVVGSLLWFGAGPATTAVLVRRRHGAWMAALCVGALGAVLLGAGSFAVLVPWNPHLAVAWLPVFLVLCLGASSVDRPTDRAARRSIDLSAAVFVGSALVQLHVGYAALVMFPLLVATVLALGTPRPVRPTEALRRAVAGGARWWWLATAVLWLPPLADQLVHGRDGNLWRLGEFFFTSDHGPPAGWPFATRALGGAAAHSVRFAIGEGEVADAYSGWVRPVSVWWTIPFVVLVVAAVLLAVRRRSVPQMRAMAIAVSALSAGLFALAQLVGDRWPYLFVWRYVVLWFVVVVSGVVIANRPTTGRNRGATAALALSVAAVGVAVLVMTTSWTSSGVLYPSEPGIEALSEDLLDLDPPDGPVSLTRFGSILLGAGDGVLLATRDAGWDVGVDPSMGYKYGDDRVVDASDAAELWLVTETSADTTLAAIQPGAVVLAKQTPLPPDTDEELTALQSEVLARFAEAGRADLHSSVGSPLIGYVVSDAGVEVDQQVIDRLTELNERVDRSASCRCAVVRVPAGTPLDATAAAATTGSGSAN